MSAGPCKQNKPFCFVHRYCNHVISIFNFFTGRTARRTALEDPPKRPRLKGGAAGGLGVKLKSLLNCDHGKNIEIRDSTQTAVTNILDLVIL